ncbi:MAG: ATP/GTP-binding protein [Candidatus Hermodarchaeota archaeon]
MKKDLQGRIHFKIVFWGPSLSGKTTALRWIYDNVEGLNKGGFTSVADHTGRTLFFDYTPMQATAQVVFDVYTVAGQRRHRGQRKVILTGVDGIIFVADSSPDQMEANTESMAELRTFVEEDLGHSISLVVMLNKQDLPNAMDKAVMLAKLGLGNAPNFTTCALTGENVKRAFRQVTRDILMYHLYPKASATASTS